MMARGAVQELDGFLADLREKSPNAAVLRRRIGERYAQCAVFMDYCRRGWFTEWKRRFPLLRFCAILRTDTNYAEIYARSGSAHVVMIDKLTAWRKNVSFPTYSWWEEDEPYRFSQNPDGTWCIEAYYWWETEPQIPREYAGAPGRGTPANVTEKQPAARGVLSGNSAVQESGNNYAADAKESGCEGKSGAVFCAVQESANPCTMAAEQPERRDLCISGKYASAPVTTIAEGAFEGNTEIRKIVLPDTIRSVGRRAFADCPNLVVCVKNDEIREQLQSAGVMVVDAAADADLAHIRLHYTYEIENGEAHILSYRGTESYVVVPAEVEGCPVTEIGPEAFCRREAHKSALRIERLIMPDTIRKIGRKAFYDTDLKEFFLPASLEEIGEYAFAYCPGPEALLLPDGLTSVEELRDFFLIKSVFVNEENPNFRARDGVLFSRDGSRLIWYPSGRTNEEYEIGEGVTEIGNRAFEVNKRLRGEGYLRRITMTDDVQSIGEKAFCNCGRLEEIRLSASLKKLGMSAFFNCIALRDIAVPSGVEAIPFGTFYMCRELQSAQLPDGIRVIGDRAFYSCRSLQHLQLPQKLEKVGDYAFHDCQTLEELLLPEGVISLGRETCSQCQHLRRAALPQSLRKIGKNAFSWCRALKALDVPAGVTNYQTWTEEDCILRLRGIPMRAVTGNRYRKMAAIGYMQMDEEERRRTGGSAFGAAADSTEVKWQSAEAKAIPRTTTSVSEGAALPKFQGVRPEFRKGYEEYIREHCREFYELAFADGTILHFLTEHEMISAEDASELLERANREKNTQAAAEILEYQNKLSAKSSSSPWDDILAGTGWF